MADLYVVNGVLIDKDLLDEGILYWNGWSSYFPAAGEPPAGGQPTIKRFGGIPYARSLNAQGVHVW